jgi:protein-L-isoaspartate O-methyltransferase
VRTLKEWLNEWLYNARQGNKRKKEVTLSHEKKRYTNEETGKEEKRLYTKYNLEKLEKSTRQLEYDISLHYLYILESCIKNKNTNTKVLDIGSKNFYYAHMLEAFFDAEITGIEIDANRKDEKGVTRGDYARAYVKESKRLTYLAEDVLQHQSHYDYITLFLPFLIPEPLKRWGLPKRLFQPDAIIMHAYNQLKPGGKMIVVNQYSQEQDTLFSILQKQHINYQNFGSFTSCFYQRYDHFVTVIVKS